eukprot:102732-Chlamydomonas_euryale.AAC.2
MAASLWVLDGSIALGARCGGVARHRHAAHIDVAVWRDTAMQPTLMVLPTSPAPKKRCCNSWHHSESRAAQKQRFGRGWVRTGKGVGRYEVPLYTSCTQ